jgi:hypothetical protein
MLAAFRPSHHWQNVTAQHILTWGLIALIAASIVSNLLQQSATTIINALVALLVGGLVGTVAWQFFKMRTMEHRLDRAESLLARKRAEKPLRTIGPTQVSHFDSEQYFYRGQTKH